MKNLHLFLLTAILLIAFINNINAQNTFPANGSVGIGTTSPKPSAILEINSTTKGVLFPKLTASQKNAIASPAVGLLIYQTDSTAGYYYYTGTKWTYIAVKSADKNLDNLISPTLINVDLLPAADNITSIGSSTLRYKDVNLYNLKFADGTVQTTAATGGGGNSPWAISGSAIYNTNTGNVGIGTTAPVSKLSVSGSSSSYNFQVTDGTVDMRIYSSSTFGQFGTYNNYPFQLMANNGTNQLVLMPSGVVGIGNGNPALGGLVADTKVGAVNAIFGSNTTGVAIESSYPGVGFNTYYISGRKFIAGGFGGYAGLDPTTGTFTIYNTSSSGTAGGTATLTSRLTIDKNGSVSMPGAVSTGNLTTTNINTSSISTSTLLAQTGSGSPVTANSTSSAPAILGYNLTTGRVAQLVGLTDSAALVVSTGNVGIGTYNPAGRLDVQGGDAYLNGVRAGKGSTNGSANGNTVFGSSSMYSNTAGSYNTATGYTTLYSNKTGNYNTATGVSGLYQNTSGSFNTATGGYALYSDTSGAYNTAAGYGSLFLNTNGANNSAFGVLALYNNTTGYSNVAMGRAALYNNTIGFNMVAIGDSALYNQTQNSFNLYTNTAVGSKTLYANTTGSSNTSIGYETLMNNTLGTNNTANGSKALFSNSNGGDNTAIGGATLFLNTSGDENSAFGADALEDNTSGSVNTAVGADALNDNTVGVANTAIGIEALLGNTIGTYNTGLGSYTNVTSNNLSDATAIGYAALVNASNKVQVGNSSVNSIGGYVGWSNFSDGRFKKDIKQNVPGLEFINKLKPVTYHLELEKFEQFLGRKDSMLNTMKSELQKGEQKLHTGFVAQDVEAVAKEINYDFDGVNHPQNEKDNYSLVYADFVPSLVKAVQELSKLNDRKNVSIDSLKQQNQQLTARLDKIEAMLSSNPSSSYQSLQSNNQTVELGSAANLSQNIPNPFTNSTVINYYLPVNNGNAFINFYGVNGTMLKTIKLSGNGKGTVNVKANELAAGTYRYTLIIDGKVVDTKQMISTK